ncbi:Ubiquinone/menaquinone biosynthesis C-methylase UbiE [Goodfellowiella coeruleoviolacea]|uniref:Ubiquinone/menaquinone biosynthesis C-methylase UbiE n=1 Tax=Goodfellowiella coeruleoviolacea TaxID=334858 RepID=A0AAE3GIT4_9PSEU|nr:Ubiquinone/menaquinone biosynthesis C-methylase UbiE [Goodfellowiella coeruleoviolacea]
MAQQYDEFANRNSDIERVVGPYREEVEIPSLCGVLGPVRGKRVLDVGCGDGVYARVIKQRGAAHVVGVDVSAGMIELARAIEAEQPLGVEYRVHDATTMPVLDAFDVVVAAAVLHYADTRSTLVRMCERMCANLVPGGRLLAYVGNPTADPRSAQANGFVLHRPADPHDGAAYTISVPTVPPIALRVHYWSRESMQEALESAGFTDIRWEALERVRVGATGSPPVRQPVASPVNLLVSARRREP